MSNVIKLRHYPELKVDPLQVTSEGLLLNFVHLEGTLYYLYIPLLEGYIVYFGKKGDFYYEIYRSSNVSSYREDDIALALLKWQHLQKRFSFKLRRVYTSIFKAFTIVLRKAQFYLSRLI